GCRLGARPIDRHIDALRRMGADIVYDSSDGYFHAVTKRLKGSHIHFEKNTHTGTEAVILAAVLADGETIITNAAKEVEIDDLICLLQQMGANIQRNTPDTIVIHGVKQLRGVEYTIMGDRNEEVTFAIAAAVTGGKIVVRRSELVHLQSFLDVFTQVGGIVEHIDETTTQYSSKHNILPVDIETRPHPGFMTDWQGPWAVFMTKAHGVSRIHETVFENRFSYVKHLKQMGADIRFYDPKIPNPEVFYNFHWEDRMKGYFQGVEIYGPTKLHNAVVAMDDIRAGATLILAALSAEGTSYLYDAENVDRGYERIEEKLQSLGAIIERIKEDRI
ncbi:MAG: UDP-N-acetylglucosamine 1-carboxyvinyltransferase, partial [Patescibacteria group bacterium]|nr:UDP-N-acetylglucosamine 1-carboxyvinyltransferase [Patescibacteria group bacterium]